MLIIAVLTVPKIPLLTEVTCNMQVFPNQGSLHYFFKHTIRRCRMIPKKVTSDDTPIYSQLWQSWAFYTPSTSTASSKCLESQVWLGS